MENTDIVRFAKVFDSNGRQLLVKKDTSDNGEPKLSIIAVFSDAEMDFGVNFKGENAEANRDEGFNKFTQVEADKFTSQIVGIDSAFDALVALK